MQPCCHGPCGDVQQRGSLRTLVGTCAQEDAAIDDWSMSRGNTLAIQTPAPDPEFDPDLIAERVHDATLQVTGHGGFATWGFCKPLFFCIATLLFFLVWNPCAASSGTFGPPPEPSGTPRGTMIGAADSWLPEDRSGRPASQK